MIIIIIIEINILIINTNIMVHNYTILIKQRLDPVLYMCCTLPVVFPLLYAYKSRSICTVPGVHVYAFCFSVISAPILPSDLQTFV